MVVALSFFTGGLWSAELNRATSAAFDQYIQKTEQRLAAQARDEGAFLWVDGEPKRSSVARRGQVLAEPWEGVRKRKVPDGLINHWVGAVFIPGVRDICGASTAIGGLSRETEGLLWSPKRFRFPEICRPGSA